MVVTTRVKLDRIASSTRNAHLGTEVIVGALPCHRVLHSLVPAVRSIYAACHDALVSCRVLIATLWPLPCCSLMNA